MIIIILRLQSLSFIHILADYYITKINYSLMQAPRGKPRATKNWIESMIAKKILYIGQIRRTATLDEIISRPITVM